GGTLVIASATQLTTKSGTLDGVTLNGNFNVGMGTSSATTTVKDGLKLNGTINLGAVDGSTYGQLYFQGTQSLSGSGSVVFGSNSSNALYAQGDGGNNPATLTIGNGISVTGGSGILGGYHGNDSFINDGTVTIASGHTLTLGGSFTTAALGNFSASGSTVNL